MSREASGTQSSDVSALSIAPLPFDLRSAWINLRLGLACSDAGGADGGEDEEEPEGDGGNGDDGTGGADGGDAATIKDPEKQRLSQEAARYRTERNQNKVALDEALARLKAIEDAEKSETDLLKAAKEELETKVSDLSGTVQKQAIRLAFFESGAAAQFRNPATALRLLDLKDIEVDDDGSADTKAIKEAADALLKQEPYLAAGGDDDGEGDGGDTANPSGRQTNGKKKSQSDLDKEALAKKFPALRR